MTIAETWNAALNKRHIDRTRTITGGLNAMLSSRLHNELRVNYSSNSRSETGQRRRVRRRRAADADRRAPDAGRTLFWALFFNGTSAVWLNDEIKAPWPVRSNIVDNLTAVAGAHQIKFGVDIRNLGLSLHAHDYNQAVYFDTEANIISGVATQAYLEARAPRAPVMRNYSAYVQDTWRATPRLTLTAGVRWEANPAAFDREGRRPFVARGLDDPATARVVLLPEGEPLYRTRPWNFAPRVGASYQLAGRRPGWDTVVRGGAGRFYDLGNASTLWAFKATPPFVSTATRYQVPFPLSPADAAPPPLPPDSGTPTTPSSPSIRICGCRTRGSGTRRWSNRSASSRR